MEKNMMVAVRNVVAVLVEDVVAGRMDTHDFVIKSDEALEPIREWAIDNMDWEGVDEFSKEVKRMAPLQYRYNKNDDYWCMEAAMELVHEDIMDDAVFSLLKEAIEALKQLDDYEAITSTLTEIDSIALSRIADGYENPVALAKKVKSITK